MSALWSHLHRYPAYGLHWEGMPDAKADPECPGFGSYTYIEECDDPECSLLSEEQRERYRAMAAAEEGLAERLRAAAPSTSIGVAS